MCLTFIKYFHNHFHFILLVLVVFLTMVQCFIELLFIHVTKDIVEVFGYIFLFALIINLLKKNVLSLRMKRLQLKSLTLSIATAGTPL